MKNKKIMKITALVLACMFLISICAISTLAAEPAQASQSAGDGLDKVKGGDIGLSERVEFALQGTATGLIMVFAVLALLAIVVSLSKVILYDMPRKARESAAAEAKAEQEKEKAIMAQTAPAAPPAAPVVQNDDEELIAVITAAIAAAIEGGEYGSEFASGFRVVSFKRVETNAWNKR